jgi:hypothetical protein
MAFEERRMRPRTIWRDGGYNPTITERRNEGRTDMPVNKDNLRTVMSYHELNDEQKAAYAMIEEAAVAFCEVVLKVLPPCGDQQAAIREIFIAKATANRGVAVKGIV